MCIHASYRPAMYVFTFSRLNTFIYSRKKEINSEQAQTVLFLFYLDDRFLLLFQQLFHNYLFPDLQTTKKKSLFYQQYISIQL